MCFCWRYVMLPRRVTAVAEKVHLGYKEQHVRKALAGLDAGGGVSVEGLLKQALKILMK